MRAWAHCKGCTLTEHVLHNLFELIKSLDVTSKVKGSEQDQERSFERYSFRTQSMLKCIEVRNGNPIFQQSSQSIHGMTRNLSRSGLSIISKRLFSPGDVIEVASQLRDGQTMYFVGSVMYSRYCGLYYNETGIYMVKCSKEPFLDGTYDTATLIASEVIAETERFMKSRQPIHHQMVL